ncbi:hypothetical protein SELMODRAFT_421761 [Selaginella moellendorffii]|uniref:Uncharacterized protein n=1 Tax=Selaginella moellendorffii TaxID=88036 RepID=D8SGA2_SELML|nr:hypothetical protein SELMODRAFT_421761 [Selaginella moellendorffii]
MGKYSPIVWDLDDGRKSDAASPLSSFSEAAAAGEDETQPIDTDVLCSGGGGGAQDNSGSRDEEQRYEQELNEKELVELSNDDGSGGCDILLEFKRAKLDTLPRWSGGRSLKLDGSDHAPAILQLKHYLPFHHMKLHNWLLYLCLSFAVVSKVSETGCRKLQRLSQSRLTGFCYQRHESSDKMSCTEVAVHGQSEIFHCARDTTIISKITPKKESSFKST